MHPLKHLRAPLVTLLLALAAPVAYAQTTPHLVASGTLRIDIDSLESFRFQQLELPAGPYPSAGPGPYEIVLEDPSGGALRIHSFDALPVEGSDEVPFAEVMPFEPGTARVVLRRGAAVLGSIPVSASPPVVTVTSPNGGELLGTSELVTWSATDPDGDPLLFDVLYSMNGGVDWMPVALAVAGNSLLWDTSATAGSTQGRIRVRAHDGLRTAQDDSDGVFVVTDKPPRIRILEPATGTRVFAGEVVRLEAIATDPEDGPLEGDAIAWVSPILGNLGQGQSRDLRLSQAGAGIPILAVAQDAAGQTAFASVSIDVAVGTDSDGDGVADGGDNCPLVANAGQLDRDADGAGDACDDSDGDGYADAVDGCPDRPSDPTDTDLDGTPDGCDNCALVVNAGPGAAAPQLDRDGDGFGNACDCDFDQDGFCSIADFSLFLPSFQSTVDPGNGTDMDGDGAVGISDFNLFLPGFQQGVPGPSGFVP